jgi:hypothetical protein
MFTLLKLRHRALVSATPSVPFGNQAKCLIEWGKFTGHALWPVAAENENQPLDTHHPDRETVLYRGGRDAAPTLTGAGDWLPLLAAATPPPASLWQPTSPGNLPFDASE